MPLLMMNSYLILVSNGAVSDHSTADGQEEEKSSHSDDSGSSVRLRNDLDTVSDAVVKETKKALPKLRSCQGNRSPRSPTKRKAPAEKASQEPSSVEPRTQISNMKNLLRGGGTLMMNAAENMKMLTRQSEPTLRLVLLIKEAERRLKFYQGQTTSVMRDVLNSISTIVHSWKTFETVSKKIEKNASDTVNPSDVNDANVSFTTRWDEIHQDVKGSFRENSDKK
ncbi:hypothetical protein GCK32_000298 [Trichostrongylus colubriformis]|uniref:Uncharacterized protein n=1 Tax=Trichostrongylus colubriformis TaxID=6319 RepID=A0AAN8F3S0_TRICO